MHPCKVIEFDSCLQLAEELRSSVTLDNLPTILMEFSQKLAVFAPYCGNYLRYCHFFNRLATQNGRIAELIREANNQGEDFMSYLIKPVQHALRYHLHVEVRRIRVLSDHRETDTRAELLQGARRC